MLKCKKVSMQHLLERHFGRILEILIIKYLGRILIAISIPPVMKYHSEIMAILGNPESGYIKYFRIMS